MGAGRLWALVAVMSAVVLGGCTATSAGVNRASAVDTPVTSGPTGTAVLPVTEATSPPPPSGPGQTFVSLEAGLQLQVPEAWTVVDTMAWSAGDSQGVADAARALGADARSLGFALEELDSLAYGPGPAGAAASLTVEVTSTPPGPVAEELVVESVAAMGARPGTVSTRPTRQGSAVVVEYAGADQRGPLAGRLIVLSGPRRQVRIDVTAASTAEADRVTGDVLATVVPVT